MKIIKIISNDRKWLLEKTPGDYVNIPADPKAINSFVYPNEITNETYYILEVSPDNNNPLNFNGIKIALSLYFKHLQEKKFVFFIHLIGFDSKVSIFYDCEYSTFLKCPNISYQQINLNFKVDILSTINSIDSQKAIELIKHVDIKPPLSYKTHHSIANEWAISRWSRYLGLKTSVDTEI
jgi:hypothetical protein